MASSLHVHCGTSQHGEASWETSTTLDPDALRECEGIMGKIYGEDPVNWPYGLDVKGHDGGVWLIREPDSRKAAGFVGWQERREHEDGRMRKVGYYSIGVLPEYRGHGYAKAAVSQLISIKSAGVDVVRAFIVPGNNRSEALARSLGVEVIRNA